MLLRLFTTLALAVISIEALPCFAPANAWGPLCYHSASIYGTRGTYVNYHVSVGTVRTTVYCQAVGMSNYIHGSKCFWGWHDLGPVNNQYISLIWDSNNAYPAIRCYGVPLESVLEWTVTSGVAALTCENRNHPNFLTASESDVGEMSHKIMLFD